MIEETEINLIEFSRTGDCSQIQKFDKKKYTDKLRKQIKKELEMPDNPENLVRLPTNKKFDKNWIKKCLNSLNF